MKTLSLFFAVTLLVACGDDETSNNANNGNNSNNANNQNNMNNGIDCQEQDEVTQVIFEGVTDSILLVDGPETWTADVRTIGFGSAASIAAPSEFDEDRPEVSVNNSGYFDKAIGDGAIDELDSVATVDFGGEMISFYLMANQPIQSLGLVGYFPTPGDPERVSMVEIFSRYKGGTEEMAACEDSLLKLATLVAASARPNPAFAGE